MSDLQVALELKASVGKFTEAVQRAGGEFDKSLKGMQGTANQTGARVEQAMQKVGIRRHREINAEIRSVERAYQTLANSGRLSQRELAQANLKMRDQIRALKSETTGWTQSLGRMKGELAVATGAILGVTRVLSGAAKASSAFQSKLAEISTLDFSGDIGELRNEIEQLSLQYGGDVTTNAAAAYGIISAGASDSAEAVSLLTAANKLAIGGVTDVSVAADGLTSIIGAYGDAAGGAANITDALFIAMRGGKTTIPELSSSIGDVSGLAKSAGVGLDEMLSAVAALTRSSGSTAKAVTQLRGVISGIIKPTAEARQEAERLGIDFDTAAIRSQGFAGWLEEVRQKTGGSEAALGKLFGNIEGLNGALQLTGEAGTTFNSILDDMANKAGATEEAVEKVMDSPEQRAARFQQAMKGVQRSLGDAVTALSPVFEGLGGLLNLFNDLPGPIRTVVAGVVGFTGAALALAPAIGAVSRAVGIMRLGFIAATGSTQANTGALAANRVAAARAAGATRLLGAAMRALPWVAVMGAIGRLVEELFNLREAKERARQAIMDLGEGTVSLNNRLAAVSESTGIAFTSMDDFRAAVESNRIEFDEATGTWQESAGKIEKLGEAIAHSTAALDDQASALERDMQALLDTASAAGHISAALLEIDPAGDRARDSIDALIGQLDLADGQQLTSLRLALADVADESDELAGLVRDQLVDSLKEADGQSLAAIIAEVNRLRAAGREAGDALSTMADEALSESFKRLGLTMESELGRISPAAEKAIAAVDGIIEGVSGLGLETETQSRAIENALVSAFERADSLAAVDALKARMESLVEQGKITEAAYRRIGEAAAEAAGKAADATAGATSEFDRLNVAIVEANGHDLTNIASEIRKLGEEGKLSADEIEKLRAAIEAKREAQIKAGKEQQQSTKTTREGTQAQQAHAAAADDSSGRMVRLGGSIKMAAEAQAIFNNRLREWQGGGTAGYIQHWKRSLEEALAANQRMQAAEARLQRLREQGVEVNQVTEASNRELRFELMRLRGEKERIAELEARDQRRALDAQIELARARGDEEQLEALRERKRLLDEIKREEEKQARERERERRQEERKQQQQAGSGGGGGNTGFDSGTSGSGPGPARSGGLGGGSSRTVTIRLDGGGSVTVPEEIEDDVLSLIQEAIGRAT